MYFVIDASSQIYTNHNSSLYQTSSTPNTLAGSTLLSSLTGGPNANYRVVGMSSAPYYSAMLRSVYYSMPLPSPSTTNNPTVSLFLKNIQSFDYIDNSGPTTNLITPSSINAYDVDSIQNISNFVTGTPIVQKTGITGIKIETAIPYMYLDQILSMKKIQLLSSSAGLPSGFPGTPSMSLWDKCDVNLTLSALTNYAPLNVGTLGFKCSLGKCVINKLSQSILLAAKYDPSVSQLYTSPTNLGSSYTNFCCVITTTDPSKAQNLKWYLVNNTAYISGATTVANGAYVTTAPTNVTHIQVQNISPTDDIEIEDLFLYYS